MLGITWLGAVHNVETIMHGGCKKMVCRERVPLYPPHSTTQWRHGHRLLHFSGVKNSQVLIIAANIHVFRLIKCCSILGHNRGKTVQFSIISVVWNPSSRFAFKKHLPLGWTLGEVHKGNTTALPFYIIEEKPPRTWVIYRKLFSPLNNKSTCSNDPCLAYLQNFSAVISLT